MREEPNIWNATEDLRGTAATLIRDHHKHLIPAHIEYLWRRKARLTGGRFTLGSAKLATEKDLALAGRSIHFIITVAADFWKRAPEGKQVALLDHELSHCGFDYEGNPVLYAHDAEEFASVIRRHGVWRKDLQPFVDAAKQLALQFDAEPKENLTDERAAQKLEMVA